MADAYDVVVSGAGPSGSQAAFLCAQAGLATALLERRHLPRDKCCAGGLLLRALGHLGQMDEVPTERRIRGICILREGARYSWSASGELGLTVKRQELDHYLAHRAEVAGCDLMPGKRLLSATESDDLVEAVTDQGRMVAKYLILAEGASGGCASSLLGAHRKGSVLNGAALVCEDDLGSGDHAGFILPSRKEGMTAFEASGARICAAFPIRNGTVLSAISRASSRSLKQAVREVAEHHGLEPMGEPCVWPIPTALRPRLATRRCLAVGDCAGMASPFSGEGLTPALESGAMAARAVIGSIASGRCQLDRYQSAARSRFGRDKMAAQLTKAAVHLAIRGPWARPLLAGLEREPAFLGAVVAVARQEDGGRRFLLRMLPRLPTLLVSGRN